MISYDSPLSVKGQQQSPANPMAANLQSPTIDPVIGAKTGPKSAAGFHRNDGKNHHIWLVTGPAGCGKTTVAEHLSNMLGMPYIEGDAYHSAANIEKMRNGTPLTDADRWDWLTNLREESIHRINDGSDGVVVTCSALKRKYRDVIRVAGYFDHRILIHFIFLVAPEEVLLKRVSQRQGHYMGANMVHSQFDIMELPSYDERDVISIDVSKPIDEVESEALERVITSLGDDA